MSQEVKPPELGVTEGFDGPTLAEYLERRGPIPVADALRLLTPCAQALAAAHRAGIVHGDIHLSNVVVCVETDGVHARLQNFAYSELHASSEVIRRDRARPHSGGASTEMQADIHAFGVMLYGVLTGPSAAESLADDVSPERSQRVKGVPPAVAEIVMRALAMQSDDRYETFDELAWELAHVSQNVSARPLRKNSQATLREMPAVPASATSRVGAEQRRQAVEPACEVLSEPSLNLTRRARSASLPTVQVQWETTSHLWIRSAEDIASIDWLSTQDALDFDAASAGESFWSRWFGHISLCVALIAFTMVAVEIVARVRIDASRTVNHGRRSQSMAMQVPADLSRTAPDPAAPDALAQVPEKPTPTLPTPAIEAAPPTSAPPQLPTDARPVQRAPTRTVAPASSVASPAPPPPVSRPAAAPRHPTSDQAREPKPLDGMNIL